MLFKGRKGIALIICYLVIVVISILGSAFLAKSMGDKRLAEKEKSSVQAFYLAEAGVDFALSQLKSGTTSGNTGGTLGTIGTYTSTWNAKAGATNQWDISATGTGENLTRSIAVVVEKKALSSNFYDNALYCSGNIDINGTAYQIQGDVTYAGTFSGDTSNITPPPPSNPTQDISISPLVRLDFVQLKEISAAQGNVYDAMRLRTDPLPDSFWYDQSAGIPNVVYVESDLTLRGNVGTVGGFFVVVGDVITNPDNVQDTTINGNGQIDGCVYTTGDFRVNGGGSGINVDGAVWVGNQATLNGNVTIRENAAYLNAIRNKLPLSTDYQIVSWQEI